MNNDVPKNEIAIRYDDATVSLTTQFLLSGDPEQLLLDCSSGPIPGAVQGEQLMPIHSRHAMPWSAVRRLSDSLRQMLEQHDRDAAKVGTPHIGRSAALPRIEGSHVK